MRALLAVLIPLLGLMAGPTGATDAPPQVPCSDPRGCPDLVVDAAKLLVGSQGEETFEPDDCAVVEGMVEPGTRKLVRFSFNTPNHGPGDLIVGSPYQHPEWFEYHPCHRHFHFVSWAAYRLWTPDGWLQWELARQAQPDQTPDEVLAQRPDLAHKFVAGNKLGFCIVDFVPGAPTLHGWAVPEEEPRYVTCTNQGITVGWADEYDHTLDGQWIDVTGLKPGAYMLEAEVNSARLFAEHDYANNRQAVPILVS